jgi:DtxR family Mn-dependent transcriptional regulator
MRSAIQNPTVQEISASLEDYLEAVHEISRVKQAARAKDISIRLGVNKSSVTGALKALAQKGLVNYAPYDLITLTGKGKRLARQIARRHEVFKSFLANVLGIEESAADGFACRVEHALPGAVIERLSKFSEFIAGLPDGEDDFSERFKRYCAEREGG